MIIKNFFILAVGLVLIVGVGCDDDTTGSTSDSEVGPAGDGSSRDLDGWRPNDGPVQVTDGSVVVTDDGGGKWVCHKTTCDGKLLQCGDCVDNDGDGKVDSQDPECLGPCDNTEGPGLESGVGGTSGSSCGVDCYFDYGNGPGNDDCMWDHSCDPLQPELPGCPYDSKMVGGKKCPATQSKKCTAFCMPFTPNGCDCFGCCTFPQLKGKGAGGADGYVWIGAMDDKKNSTCTFKGILDNKKCPPCTPIKGCNNPCGKCEICIGKPTIPPECFKKPDAGVGKDASTQEAGVPPSLQCPGGESPCGLSGQSPCAQGFYCISGCCIKVVIN